MKHSRIRIIRVTVALVAIAASGALVAVPASAATGQAVGIVTPDNASAGATEPYGFDLSATSGQISSFNLSPPGGWKIFPLSSPPAGVTLVTLPSGAQQIQGRSVTASSSAHLAVAFSAQAPCSAASTGWTLVAKSGGNFTGSTFQNGSSSDLSTGLAGTTCKAAFVSGPADAAFNGGSASQNMTSAPYDPSGDPMQVQVLDGTGAPRNGISITLGLQCTLPVVCGTSSGQASISGPITVSSATVGGIDGIAEFTGTSANPIAINLIGLNYQLEPTGTGVTGTPSGPFGIYQDGHGCAPSCKAHGNNGGIDSTVTATGGTNLAVLVSPLVLDCGPAFVGRSSQVTVWKYVGTNSQTLVLVVDKSLLTNTDRGSAHLDFCFDGEGKTFTDKFGVVHDATNNPTPGLLPDCSSTITTNCIVSETSSNKGARIITVTVEDGHGRI